MIRHRGPFIDLDYQLRSGHTRVVRFVHSEWQIAEHVPMNDFKYGLIDQATCCQALHAIVMTQFREKPKKRTFVEAATDFLMSVIGVGLEDECEPNGRAK